jgi:hypothetical protein
MPATLSAGMIWEDNQYKIMIRMEDNMGFLIGSITVTPEDAEVLGRNIVRCAEAGKINNQRRLK